MKRLLRYIGAISVLNLELNTSKADFIQALETRVDDHQADWVDLVDTGKNRFKGIINSSGFVIRKKRSFFGTNPNPTKVKGVVDEKNGKLLIELEINGWSNQLKILYSFLLLFYPFFLTYFLLEEMHLSAYLITLQGCMMFGMPYLMMRRGVNLTKNRIMRELSSIME